MAGGDSGVEDTGNPTVPSTVPGEDPATKSGKESGEADSAELTPARRWSIVAVAMVATFMAMMDSYIVNVAIPTIRTDLEASSAMAGLTVSSYVLVYGLFLVMGGRLGDIHGYRVLFVAGLAAFTVASVGCGLAWSVEVLVAMRCLQGLSAACFFPQTLSIVQTSFAGRWRMRALALLGVTTGLAAVAGQIVGGVLLHVDLWGSSWRPIFLVNVPVGLATIAAAIWVMPRRRGEIRSGLDVRGTGALTAALLLLLLPLAEGSNAGWPVWCWAMLLASAPAFALFWWWEHRLSRSGGHPLIHPELLRVSQYRAGNAVFLSFFAGNAGLFFVLAVQLQSGMGYSALDAAMVFTPLAVAFTSMSLLVPRIQARIGSRVLSIGYGVNALGYLLLLGTVLLTEGEFSGGTLVPALIVTGLGQGLGISPLLGAALGAVPPSQSGTAAGVLETSGQIGMSLGVTVIGLVYFTALNSPSHTAGQAFGTALIVNVFLAVVCVVFVPALRKSSAVTKS